MILWRWPRPGYALHEAPEVACVDALGITLQICVAVLRADNPVRENGRLRDDAVGSCDDSRVASRHRRDRPKAREVVP